MRLPYLQLPGYDVIEHGPIISIGSGISLYTLPGYDEKPDPTLGWCLSIRAYNLVPP